MTSLAIKHPGELTLRRFVAQEALDPSIGEHIGTCGVCSARISKFKEEQKAFEAEVPFERFAAGVERAARQQKAAPRKSSVVNVLIALAACFVAVFAGKQVLDEQSGGSSRLKGGTPVEIVIGGAGIQRRAGELEQLVTGERVQIGVNRNWRCPNDPNSDPGCAARESCHVLALSIDDAGEVSNVFSDKLAIDAERVWLPFAIEFTGKGREYLVVLLSDAPLSSESMSQQLAERFKAANGDLTKLTDLDFTGVQVHRTFLKP